MVEEVHERLLIAFGPKLRAIVKEATRKWLCSEGDTLKVSKDQKPLVFEPIIVVIPNTTCKTMQWVLKFLTAGKIDVPEADIDNFNSSLSAFGIKATMIEDVQSVHHVATSSNATSPVEANVTNK